MENTCALDDNQRRMKQLNTIIELAPVYGMPVAEGPINKPEKMNMMPPMGDMPPMGPQSGDMPPAQNMEPIQNPFEDVSESDEYYQAVLWAVQNGITNGVTDTLFKPQDTVTRAQSLTFLYRWTNPDSHEEENPFVDVSRGSYYYDAVLWAAKNKITTGTTATTFTPNSTLNKAYFLTFLYRYMEADLMPM